MTTCLLPLLLGAALLVGCGGPGAKEAAKVEPGPLRADQQVRGWNILSDSEPDDLAVIAAAPAYGINHLQLSHDIVHELRQARDERRRGLANRLTDTAHAAGIQEVILWDHALYDLDYYPERFRTGPGGTIDLDNAAFWEWFRQDYREMLDLVPEINGLMLTFIETGARAERQQSTKFTTPQEKLAAVVNAVADVVIGERHLNLYARTFAYTHEEYDNIVGAIDRIERPEVRLMMKETPHDFFLTHPNDFFAGKVARPTLMEFDAAGEFNGQGLIANTWPQYILARWHDFSSRPHVIGYVARTDRYHDTRLIGRPGEINLLALKMGVENPDVDPEVVYDTFITSHYGKEALPNVKVAFKNAFDIVTSTLYTLGTNVANHSKLDYDPYSSSYARHVTGKWLEPPVAHIEHGVNRDLHYWKEVIDHIAPPWAKRPGGAQMDEVSWVIKQGWVTPREQMNEEYLGYILTEKDYGVKLAQDSLEQIEQAKPHLSEADYQDLHHYFARTLLTARLHRAVAAAYYGFRVYARVGAHRTPTVLATVREGLRQTKEVSEEIENYPVKPAAGQWNWVDDTERAMQYYTWITKEGWPKETSGFKNPYGGMTVPME
jgi:hypothetical protein